MIETLIALINTYIEELDLFNQRLGLCEIIEEKGSEIDISFPAIYCGKDEYKRIEDYDLKKGIVYHRKTGKVTIDPQDDSSVTGCENNIKITVPMRAVAIIKKSSTDEDDNNYIDDKIASNLIVKITRVIPKATQLLLKAHTSYVEVTSYNTNRYEVWDEEHKNIEMEMDFKYVYMAIDYNIIIEGSTDCLEICNRVFDIDASAYFTLAAITNPTQMEAISTFITTLKVNSIWSKILDMSIDLSGDSTIANALDKLKYPSTFSTSLNNGSSALVNGDYSATLGINTALTNRKIDTQVIPSDHGLSKDNFCYIAGVLSDVLTGSGNIMFDNKTSGGSAAYIGKTAIGMNGGGLQVSVPQNGVKTYIRSLSSNGTVIYVDDFCNVIVPTAVPDVTIDTSVSLLTGRSFGSVSTTTGAIGFHCIASYLTYSEIVIVTKSVRTLWTALGRKPATKECVVFGDSITFGTGASAYNLRFSYLLAGSLGLIERNQGIGGSGYRTTTTTILHGYDRRSDILNYDILNGGKVYILYGLNDCRNDTGSGTASIYNDLRDKMIIQCNELKALGMSASNIILGGIPYVTEAATNQTRRNNYSAAIREAAVISGVYYAELDAYMQANGGAALISADTIHPNDLGHSAIRDGLLLAAAV